MHLRAFDLHRCLAISKQRLRLLFRAEGCGSPQAHQLHHAQPAVLLVRTSTCATCCTNDNNHGRDKHMPAWEGERKAGYQGVHQRDRGDSPGACPTGTPPPTSHPSPAQCPLVRSHQPVHATCSLDPHNNAFTVRACHKSEPITRPLRAAIFGPLPAPQKLPLPWMPSTGFCAHELQATPLSPAPRSMQLWLHPRLPWSPPASVVRLRRAVSCCRHAAHPLQHGLPRLPLHRLPLSLCPAVDYCANRSKDLFPPPASSRQL